MSELTLVDEVDDWLSRQPFTKWADWDIKMPNRRRLAAEWFARQYEAFEAYRSGYQGDPGDDDDAWHPCEKGCTVFYGLGCRQPGCNGEAPPDFVPEPERRFVW